MVSLQIVTMKKIYLILLVVCFVLAVSVNAFAQGYKEAHAWQSTTYDDTGWFTVNTSASWTVEADVWIDDESSSRYAAASVYTEDNDHWMASVELSGEGEDSDYDAGTKQVTEPLDFKCVANAGVSGSGIAEALATLTW